MMSRHFRTSEFARDIRLWLLVVDTRGTNVCVAMDADQDMTPIEFQVRIGVVCDVCMGSHDGVGCVRVHPNRGESGSGDA